MARTATHQYKTIVELRFSEAIDYLRIIKQLAYQFVPGSSSFDKHEEFFS
jgi:hypothetical protein